MFRTPFTPALCATFMLLGSGVCSHAIAQEGPRDGGRFSLAAVSTPEYMGSDERRTLAAPMVEYQWANGWFAGLQGVGRQWSLDNGAQYGVKLGIEGGRDESRSAALKGLGTIDPAADLAGFVRYPLGGGLAAQSGLHAVSGSQTKGLLWDLGLQVGASPAPDWLLGLGVSATYANTDYMQTYFGITPAQAAASGYAVYQAAAGLRDVQTQVSLTYRVSPPWALTGVLSTRTLLGSAKDAPMVKKASDTTAVISLSRSF